MALSVKRSGRTNQFIVEMRGGIDSVRCAIQIEGATGKFGRDESGLRAEAGSRAKRPASAMIASLNKAPG